MIKVCFKKEKSNEFNNEEFTYADYKDAAVGDIVVVNTRYGYAIAKVAAINVIDEKFLSTKLSNVVTVIEGQKEREARFFVEQHKLNIIKNTKTQVIKKALREFCSEEDLDIFTYEELVELYKEIF